jgi:3-oxoacyl-[acyl-carrier protein] reductase
MSEVYLSGKVAVVTGASRGIGLYMCELLGGQGASLAMCARNADALEGAKRGLIEKYGVKVFAMPVDVSDASAVRGFAEQVTEELGPVDILVNNAGMLGPVGALQNIDLGSWKYALEVNVMGVVNMTSAFLPGMVAKKGGSVINLSGAGVGGPKPWPRISAYSTSKAAVVSLTESLALEAAEHGVRVNAVAPGGLETGFMDAVIDAGPEVAGQGLYEAMQKLPAANGDALDRFGALVVYLVSERGAWVTGRLLSARWDDEQKLEKMRDEISDSSLLQLRRIDGDLFVPAPVPVH